MQEKSKFLANERHFLYNWLKICLKGIDKLKLPTDYTDKMKALLGDEYPAYIDAFSKPRLYGLRVNTLKISTAEFEKICPFPITKIPYIDNGYFYDGDLYQPAKHPYYFAGLYYLQDPSAMTPASRIPVSRDNKVLDLCAAPGGKSTELAAKLAGTGLLVANDISAKRAKALQKNIELFGVRNSLITTEYPEKLSRFFNGYFDRILIDAPCSGEGMFRKDPDMIKAWDTDSPKKYAAMQKDIVKYAVLMLAPGGYLLYSTCTFSPLEDEETVMEILRLDKRLSLCDIAPYEGFAKGRPDVVKNGISDLEKCVRIFPHKMDGEGHFLALFHMEESDETHTDIASSKRNNKSNKKKISKEDLASFEEFRSHLKINMDTKDIESHEGMLFYDKNIPEAKGLSFLRKGLFLGECKKKRFEPSQALAMAIRSDEYDNILNLSADDDRVIRYLKGETISAEGSDENDGLILICVDGYPLGWGKKQRQTIKNKYHSGWRLM